MLSGRFTKPEDIPHGDFRKTIPRFHGENFSKNLELVHELEKIAKNKGCSPAQLAIGWVREQSKNYSNLEIFPIPGATTAERVQENSNVISLTGAELAQIESILQSFKVAGARYGEKDGAEHLEG